MKRYKVSPTLKACVEAILYRRNIPYTMEESDGEIYCSLEISNADFHRIIIRAKMEKIEQEKGCSIPIIAAVEESDPVVMEEICSDVYYNYDEQD